MSASSVRSPTLSEVIRAHIDARLDELHTCLPAVVSTYDAATQRASVKPLIKHAYYDEEDHRQTESMALITGVPVQFLSAGGFMLTCPISTGTNGLGAATTGTLFFSEASLDAWLSSTGGEVDPGVDHRFQLSDGVFIPGLNPFGAPLQHVAPDHAVLGSVKGLQIHLRDDKITVGDESGSLPIARHTDPVALGGLSIATGSTPPSVSITWTSPDTGVTLALAIINGVVSLSGTVNGTAFSAGTDASFSPTPESQVAATTTHAYAGG